MTDSKYCDSWNNWIDQRVCVQGINYGTLRYFGEIQSKHDLWCGVELDKPIGKNDGMIDDVRYFTCKSKHGVFVPQLETSQVHAQLESIKSCQYDILISRSDEHTDNFTTKSLNSTFGLPHISCKTELHYGGVQQLQNHSDLLQLKILNSNDLNHTFDANKSINMKETLCTTMALGGKIDNSLLTDVAKESKSSLDFKKQKFARLDSEESLGIIADLLEGDISLELSNSDFSDLNETVDKTFIQQTIPVKNIDSVFSPPMQNFTLVNNFPYNNMGSPLLNYVNTIPCTSTPKHTIMADFNSKNFLDMGNNQSFDFDLPEAKIEPVLAGSNNTKSEIDIDISDFKGVQILSSTSKLLPNICPIKSSLSVELNDVNLNYQNTADPEYNLNTTQIIFNNCTKKGTLTKEGKENKVECTDVLSETFEIKPSANTIAVLPNQSPLNTTIAYNKVGPELSCIFEDSTKNYSKEEKTFIVDNCSEKGSKNFSPNEIQDQVFNTVGSSSDQIKNKKCSAIDLSKYSNDLCNLPSQKKPICSEKNINSLKSSKFIPGIKSKDLNSTFCLKDNTYKTKQNPVPQNFNKRHSLSSVSSKSTVMCKPAFKKPFLPVLKANAIKSLPRPEVSAAKSSTKANNSILSKSQNINEKKCKGSQSLNKTISNCSQASVSGDLNESKKCVTGKLNLLEERNISINSSKDVLKLEDNESIPNEGIVKVVENSKLLTSCRNMDTLTLGPQENSNEIVAASDLNISNTINEITANGNSSTNLPAEVFSKPDYNKTFYKKTSMLKPKPIHTVKAASNHEVKLSESVAKQEPRTISKPRYSMLSSKPRNSMLPSILPIKSVAVDKRNQAQKIFSAPVNKEENGTRRSCINSHVSARISSAKSVIPSSTHFVREKTDSIPKRDFLLPSSSSVLKPTNFSQTMVDNKLSKKQRNSFLPIPQKSKKNVSNTSNQDCHTQPSNEALPIQNCEKTSRRLPVRKLQSPRSYQIRS